MLSDKIKPFLFHAFVKRQQSSFFEMIKGNVDDKHDVLQVDYSENFSIVEQDEIQNAHCSRKQLSLFTAHLWYQSATYPLMRISNEVSHNKYTVSKCLELFLTRLHSLAPSLEELFIFSDGSANQFKQRYLFKNLTYLTKNFNIKLSWNFFASNHGK
ncbi:unnamed protein product, partial [Rotaria magnacalcarata]